MNSTISTSPRRKVLVTAALPYSNGDLHVGHLGGAYVPADVYVRYLRLTGADVRFICGSDDHGVAIMITGEKEGKTPAEVADYYRARQAEDFRGMKIDFDIYSGTSINPFHAKASQDFFKAVYEKGYFVKQSSRQFYDESRSAFLPDRYVQGTCGFCDTPNQNGDQCENCGKVLDVESLKDATSVLSGNPAVIRETVHWFLDLSKFRNEVEGWVESAQLRDHTRAYVKGLISTGLVKRAMTRDISWGIPVPLDDPDAKGKVLYVWFDAPIGYISNTMELCQQEGLDPNAADQWWRSKDVEIRHFIGEDNTIFHCVIWIAMLSAEGSLTLPNGVIVNQYFNIQFPGKDVEKISKSRGTAVWVRDLVTEGVDPDSVRFYLTSIATERARSVYKPDDLERRHNSELADTLGNFVNRITSFTLKYCGPQVPELERSRMTERDLAFEESIRATFEEATAQLEGCSFKGALERIMEFARECNRYVDEKAPWSTRKTDMDTTRVTLACSLRAIHALGVMLMPFLPGAAPKILSAFGREAQHVSWRDAVDFSIDSKPLSQPPILFQKIGLQVPSK
jgi:methionyl-tRNA synthetase